MAGQLKDLLGDAILEAVIERSQIGDGRALALPMFDTVADLMSVPLLHYDYGKKDTLRVWLSQP
jgi:crotonobetainyl-CoA:carnitine CoA-transferase CaiB-like acyl-CoA transferase